MKHDFLYSVEREVKHSLDTLWHAWTDTDSLAAWYHPVGFSVPAGTALSDPTVGGKWSIAVEVPMDGSVHYFFGRYLKVEPKKAIEHSMHYSTNATDFATQDESTPWMLIKIDFEDRGTSSWVRFTQYGELPEGQAEMAKAGMESYLDSLEAHLG